LQKLLNVMDLKEKVDEDYWKGYPQENIVDTGAI
jgi:hypothetical protein